MGHLGLTPQSVEGLGGHKVQGRTESEAEKIYRDALALQEGRLFCLGARMRAAKSGATNHQQLRYPTIGIGAGVYTDGQVLVLQDMLGMQPSFKPKFLRHYLDGHAQLSSAVNAFHQDVTAGAFPNCEEVYR
jgi:3-methyl-2-oxobutanoate hydroxymethyltransferase